MKQKIIYSVTDAQTILWMLSGCTTVEIDENRGTWAPSESINLPDDEVYEEVQEGSLAAYWNFNNQLEEEVENRVITVNKMMYARDRKDLKSSAYSGNGTDTWFTVDADAALLSPDVTVSVWLRATKITGGTGFLLALTQSWNNGYSIWQEGTAEDELRFKVVTFRGEGNGHIWFDHTGDFPVDQWFHFAYVYDSSTGTVSVYVNGSSVFESDPAGASPLTYTMGDETADKLYVGFNGGQEAWISPYGGLMDDLRIYNSALTADDITQIYNIEKP